MKTKEIIFSLLALALIYGLLFITLDKAMDVEMGFDDAVIASYK